MRSKTLTSRSSLLASVAITCPLSKKYTSRLRACLAMIGSRPRKTHGFICQ